jgi:tRNA-specific adenosine deaminase 3
MKRKLNFTANGALLEITNSKRPSGFHAINIWTTVVPARLSAAASAFIKDAFPEDTDHLGHVRRFTTAESTYEVPAEHATDAQGKPVTFLRMMVCTEPYLSDAAVVEDLLRPLVQIASDFHLQPKHPKTSTEPAPAPVAMPLYYEPRVELRTTARYTPETKQESAEWSRESGWPLMWRGNTAAIPTEMSERDQQQALRYLAKVAAHAKEEGSAIATLIVDPEADTIVGAATDSQRDAMHRPLEHAAMAAVARVADWRQAREDNSDGYLCRGFHVYSTHEPCAMCAMALLHSRVTRLVYIEAAPSTGAIEPESSGLCIHAQDRLNWQYEAWKYVGARQDLGEAGDSVAPVAAGVNV